MHEHQTSRTLVKSLPELWAECSDAAALARHLGAFGEIRITRLEPESTVAWEGDAARGTVRLETAGWGTRVTLTLAGACDGGAPPQLAPAPTTAQAAGPPRAADRPVRGLIARLRGRWRRRAEVPAPEPEPVPDPEPPAPEPGPEPRPATPLGEKALAAALDSLGRAHHRPFSRA